MKCLHNEEAGSSTTKNGTFWFCVQPYNCHFLCSEVEKELYENGVREFLSLNKEQPRCHCGGEFAKMKIVKDPTKETYGRPFFSCSGYGCKYFEWFKDLAIPKPLCEHGEKCNLFKVRKEGKNKGRAFFKCPKSEKCRTFIWYEPREEPKNAAHDPNHVGESFTDPPETHTKTKEIYTTNPKDQKRARSEAIPIPGSKSRKIYDAIAVTHTIPGPLSDPAKEVVRGLTQLVEDALSDSDSGDVPCSQFFPQYRRRCKEQKPYI